MMYRCSSSNPHGNMVGGPCSCGLYHCPNNSSSSFSMFFSMSAESTINHHHHDPPPPPPNYHHQFYSFSNSPNSSSVDCTLSLGTPSSRADHHYPAEHGRQEQPGAGRRSSFCWDLLSPNKYANTQPPPMGKSGRGSAGAGGGAGESLLARRCANCDTTSTPLWRNGPRGPKSLCNACGIRYKKEERRATAAAATNGGSGVGMDHHQYQSMNNAAGWVHHQKMAPPSCGEFRFVEEDDNFLSWRLNVTDHSRNLVHDFTR